MRTNDKDVVRFRFLYAPEVIRKGDSVLLREGRTKVLGNVIEVGGSDEGVMVKTKKVLPAFG